MPGDGDITRALRAVEAGDAGAVERLWALVYEELRSLAARRVAAERPGATLGATALVNEAYLRLAGDDAPVSSRAHFFGAAAEAIRRILVERARARGARKRGGGLRPVTLDANALTVDAVPDAILDLDEALATLAAEDPRKARLVELRFFAGLPLSEVAEVLGISPDGQARLGLRACLVASGDSADPRRPE